MFQIKWRGRSRVGHLAGSQKVQLDSSLPISLPLDGRRDTGRQSCRHRRCRRAMVAAAAEADRAWGAACVGDRCGTTRNQVRHAGDDEGGCASHGRGVRGLWKLVDSYARHVEEGQHQHRQHRCHASCRSSQARRLTHRPALRQFTTDDQRVPNKQTWDITFF